MTNESKSLWQSLARVNDPEILRPITELGMVRQATVDPQGNAHVTLLLTTVACPAALKLEADTLAAASTTPGVKNAAVTVEVMTPAERQQFTQLLRGKQQNGHAREQFSDKSRTRVIAVTSGKGGVGKSSITANLAVALAALGRSVALIDADVFGFSIPALMGLTHEGEVAKPTRLDDMILPPVAHGVKVISIGMFLGEADTRQTAVSWRGPMLHRTIEQFLRDVWFDEPEFLLLDLPPGTGDIAISIGQLLPQAEVLVVTTPQTAASDVAVRSGLVARQTGQRVIGVVENMAAMQQADGTLLELFGAGGGKLAAERLSTSTEPVPLLTSIPLSPAFRVAGDQGVPAALSDAADPAAAAILLLAKQLAN